MKAGTVVITSAEYYDLCSSEVKLDLIKAMLKERLDGTYYARIDDICEILGIKRLEVKNNE